MIHLPLSPSVYGCVWSLRRLWHQLTEELVDFVRDPTHHRDGNFIQVRARQTLWAERLTPRDHVSFFLPLQLYNRVVLQVDQRMHPLNFVIVSRAVANSLCPRPPYDPDSASISSHLARVIQSIALSFHFWMTGLNEAIEMLKEVRDRSIRTMGEGPHAVADLEVASLELKRGNAAACRVALEEHRETIARLEAEGVEPAVPAAYHRVAAEYHAEQGPPGSFYEHGLLYLAHTPEEEIAPEERTRLARDLVLAALVADTIHDFGVLIAHPILRSLDGTPEAWMRELMATFQRGNIDEFNGILAEHREAFDRFAALRGAEETIKEKIALVALMELVSSRPAHERSISFEDIAEATRLPVESVEWLLMRGMSLGLVEGAIDEVDGVVHVSQVKPRVLDMSQVAELHSAVDGWRQRVHQALVFVEDRSNELFA